MRATAGPLLLHLAFLAAGLGILRAFGIVKSATPVRWLAAAGLAYLAGVIGVVLTCIALLVLGFPLSFELGLGVAAALALPFGLELRPGPARNGPPLRRPRLAPEQWLAAAVLTAFAVVAVVGLLTVGVKAVDQYDAWNLWTRKAILLFDGGALPLDVFSQEPYRYVHPDYPMLLPVLEALHLRSVGRLATGSIHIALWLQLVAFVWSAAFLASRVTTPIVAALIPAAAAVVSAPVLLTAYADVPLAFLLCLGVLAVALWLDSGRRSDLALAALLLAGAASVKNEGLVGVALTFAVAAATLAAGQQWRRLPALAAGAAGVLAVAVVPWRLWLSAHDLRGDIPISRGLDPTYLFSAERWDRVWPSVEALHGQLVNWTSVAVFVPLALALAAVRLRGAHRSSVAGFYLGVGCLYAASLVWAYWISPLDLTFHITHSVDRIYVGVAFIAVAGAVHLIGRPPLTVADD